MALWTGVEPWIYILAQLVNKANRLIKIKNKEMHHTIRYKKKLYFELYFYGEDIADEEKEIAKNMVKANCINLNVTNFTVSFLETIN